MQDISSLLSKAGRVPSLVELAYNGVLLAWFSTLSRVETSMDLESLSDSYNKFLSPLDLKLQTGALAKFAEIIKLHKDLCIQLKVTFTFNTKLLNFCCTDIGTPAWNILLASLKLPE